MMQHATIEFNKVLMEIVLKKASQSERGRAMYFFEINKQNLHGEGSSSQAFINCIKPGSYVPPHKHVNYSARDLLNFILVEKLHLSTTASLEILGLDFNGNQQAEDVERWELFVIMKGTMKVLTFTDEGVVSQTTLLSKKDNATSVVIIPPNTYHAVVALKETIVFEFKNGWYDALKDKKIASWAPEEQQEGSEAFRKWLEIAKVGQNAQGYKNYLKLNESRKNSSLKSPGFFNTKSNKSSDKKPSFMSELQSMFCCRPCK